MNVIISLSRRFLTKDNNSELVENIIANICIQYPNDNFYLLSYGNKQHKFSLPSNVQTVTATIPYIAGPVKTWIYQRNLKVLVKKFNAQTLLHIDDYIPANAPATYLLLTSVTNSKPYKLKKLNGIIVSSFSIKNTLVKNNIDPSHIKVMLPMAFNIYQPLDWDAREKTKEHFSGGKEYFLFNAAGASHINFLNVLKGFSAVKKWLKSGVRLTIVNMEAGKNTDDLLNTYKYKSDVLVSKKIDNIDYPKMTAAALAFIYLPQSGSNGLPLVEAMQCNVPVITWHNNIFFELGNDAVLYVDPGSEQDVGEKMTKIYKDEKTRTVLIQRSRAQLQALAVHKAAAVFE
ncbi:MAG: glycosyltransferase [Agriterribacter sp.]